MKKTKMSLLSFALVLALTGSHVYAGELPVYESGTDNILEEIDMSEEDTETSEEEIPDEDGEVSEEEAPGEDEKDSGEVSSGDETEIPDKAALGEDEDSDEVIVDASYNGYTYTLYKGEARITGYTGTATTLTIPSSVSADSTTYPVTEVSYNAFKDHKTITSVTVPASITTIGSSAFAGCISLTKVTLNEGLTSLGASAFKGCIALKSIVIPSTVTSMGSYVFTNCDDLETAEIKTNIVSRGIFSQDPSLHTVKLSNSVNQIEPYAFYKCTALKNINIPSSLKIIDTYSFYYCTSLKSIALNEGLMQLGDSAFCGCTALEKIVVPSTVSTVGTDIFYRCTGLLSANIKCAFTGKDMFRGCTGLKTVTFSNNLTFIDSYSFYDCDNLNNVTLPSKLTNIGAYAFYDCDSLSSIIIPKSVSNVGKSAFYSCDNLVTASVNSKVISESMFSYDKKLETVIFGSSVQTIGDNAFRSCDSLKTADIGEKVTSIGEYAFASCDALQVVVIPASVKTIGNYAFNYDTKLASVTLANGLTTIGTHAFYGNSKLSTIYIPKSVNSIGKDAFTNTGLRYGVVYCEKNSTADNTSYYPVGTTIRYGKPQVSPPKFTVKGVIGGRDVTFSSDTKGAVIYYSTTSSKLTTADKCVTSGTKVTFSDFYGTVYARAYCNGEWSNVSRLILKIPVVNTPTITQSGGKVTIKCTTPDSMIYYTTNGTTPSPSNGIKVNSSTATFTCSGGTVKAIAVRSCFTNSAVAEKKITSSVSSSVKVPSFKVVGVFGGRDVTFTSESGATIYYSSTTSSLTTSDTHVKSGGKVTFEDFYGTIYARAYKDGKWSNPSRLILKIPVVNKPTITSSEGGYVTIKTTTPGCRIIYTTDGSTPSLTNGKVIYSSVSKVYVGTGKTVKAIAVRSCFTNSKVATYRN